MWDFDFPMSTQQGNLLASFFLADNNIVLPHNKNLKFCLKKIVVDKLEALFMISMKNQLDDHPRRVSHRPF